jgi:DNA repair photolyase
LHKTKEDFNKVYARKNILELVKKEIHLYSGKKVFLSFVSDPYPAINKELRLTRSILQLFRDYNVIPIILTKSKQATTDFDVLQNMPDAEFGMTMTFSVLNQEASFKYEPKASTPIQRYYALEYAHAVGIKTWVSLEPVIDPVETLKIVDETYEIVDQYKVGKLNYAKSDIDWKKFLNDFHKKMDEYGNKFLIKDSLKKYQE